MIFGSMKGRKQAEPSLIASAVDGPFLPGDRVDVELTWPVNHDSIDISLELVCRETFWYTVKSTGAAFIGQFPGHAEENHTGLPYTAAGRPGRFKTSRDLVFLTSRAHPLNQSHPQAQTRGIARFQLPTTAPPSISGNTACIEWQLWARPASTPSRDAVLLGSITVRPISTDTIGGQHEQHPSVSIPPSSNPLDFSITVENRTLMAGQTLHGVLQAKAQSDINITKIRAELQCVEQAGAKQSSLIYAKANLLGRSVLLAGQEYRWPFQLQVPDLLLPSANLDETSVVWQVKGILGRAFRTRLEIAKQIQVLTSS